MYVHLCHLSISLYVHVYVDGRVIKMEHCKWVSTDSDDIELEPQQDMRNALYYVRM